MYAAFGVASPFLPAFLGAQGLSSEDLGIALAAGTAIRLLAAPAAGRIGDVLHALRGVLAVCALLAACAALGYLSAHGFWLLLAMSLVHAAALAPITVLADALALGSAAPRSGAGRGFEYGWVRGSGSAAFIAGTLLAGQAVGAFGLEVIVWLQATLLAAAALVALRVPNLPAADVGPAALRSTQADVLALLRIPLFRNLVLVAALILGSHAMHDAFAVIRWSSAGISTSTASLLWSLSVAAEVLVFFVVGPAIVTRLTPAGAIAIAAVAGVLRWAVMAQSTDIMAIALVQPLHGITFALLHLACMRLIARIVPPGLEGSAQAIYATVGIGGATALLTLLSGPLYGRFDGQGFWAMAALCVLALPLARRLRERISP